MKSAARLYAWKTQTKDPMRFLDIDRGRPCTQAGSAPKIA